MSDSSPQHIYGKQKQKHVQALHILKRKQNLLGWIRLAVIIVASLIAYFAFTNLGVWGWLVVAIGIAAFLAIVSIDASNNEAISYTTHLIEINEEELNVLSYNYYHRYDGSEFLPVEHAYAADIDLFGKASIFQLVNRCQTEPGRQLLAANLTQLIQVDRVQERQAAAKEIAPLLEWRQAFQATAMATPVTKVIQQKIGNWLQQDDATFTSGKWRFILPIYSFIAVATAIAAILNLIPTPVFSFLFLVYFITGTFFSRKVMQAYLQLSGMVKSVDTLSELIRCIEEQPFNSSLLAGLQKSIQTDQRKAYSQIKELKEILNRFDLRLNVFVFIVLNSFLLWDVRQMRALNKWKANNKTVIPKAFTAIAEFEVVNSLAVLHFNQPDWAFPLFADYFTFQGTAIGHPLLATSKRVTSDFSLKGKGKIALITGSNMAGKSTFLRSLAVNLVLAQIGAPVCARSFTVSAMELMSSMRIADNLAENTSTFYAELKKLESIITAVKQHKPMFILLDEILRGTNSLDRHIGSKALIRQLIKEQAVAIIATHDIELTKLEEKFGNAIENYHFDVQVENDELYFDYKLKHGVCHSLNASLLMKKIGIEL
jgi:DNA mismatch repair ATPase MutS